MNKLEDFAFVEERAKVKDDANLAQRILYKMSRATLQRATHERIAGAEDRRREKLGPVGRIREDILAGLRASAPARDERHVVKAAGLPLVPIGDKHPDSLSTPTVLSDYFVSRYYAAPNNVAVSVGGKFLAFAVGINPERTEARDPHTNEVELYVVGKNRTEDEEYTGWEYLSTWSLSHQNKGNLALLEEAASEMRRLCEDSRVRQETAA